ncbi:MAG: capsular biosynthesis protein [Lachnospiraceae bacterium]|jgi:hypothetical protein|nr:capsular biosynthesis protein [Lachnospiraceae bacterium]
MGVLEIFKNQGGMKLIQQYWQSGAFFTAVGEFLLLGKSRTSLEILRLSTELKTKQKLEKRYRKNLKEFNDTIDKNLPKVQSNKVWVCWFQGMESAPELVQRCYHSLQKNLTDREIILITEKNMQDYVQFPEFILEKWKRGQITHTHMTDLLRLELLIRYGGMWIDATVLCTRKREEIPEYYFDSELFLYQCLKPGRDGHTQAVSSWLISAKSNNKMLMAVRYLCYEYWKEHSKMLDYFLLHDFIAVVFDYYPEECRRIIQRDNATPHILLLRMFEPYEDRVWEAILEQAPFHKLSYKFASEKADLKGTFYKKIVEVIR